MSDPRVDRTGSTIISALNTAGGRGTSDKTEAYRDRYVPVDCPADVVAGEKSNCLWLPWPF